MKSRRILSIIGLILAAVLLLGIGFAIGRNEVQATAPDATDAAGATGALRSQDGAPPKDCGIWAAPRFWTNFTRQGDLRDLRNQGVFRRPSLSMFP